MATPPLHLARWTRRLVFLILGGAAVLLLSACEPIERSFVVNSTVDAPDAAQGDNLCATVSGQCTLRAAIQEANATPGLDQITLEAGATYTITRAGANENLASTGDLDITRPLILHGHGATIDGNDLDRVFHVRGVGRLTADHLTITGGQAPVGAGLAVDAGGRLHLTDSTVTGNQAPSLPSPCPPTGCGGMGAGIANSGQLTLAFSTISSNVATGFSGCPGPQCFPSGGGLANSGTAGVLHSTFSGNQAVDGVGGAIVDPTDDATTPTAVLYSTFVDNDAGPSPSFVWAGNTLSGGMSVWASALAGPAPVCGGFLNARPSSGGYNAPADFSCLFEQVTDRPPTPFGLVLGSLADNGRSTLTHLPAAGSPLVDGIPVGASLCSGTGLVDQRHQPRPQGGGCDIGAVESPFTAPPVSPVVLVVDSAVDATDANVGNGTCETAGSGCTLRAAIDEANAHWPRVNTITVAPGVDPVLSLPGMDDDFNATGDLDINGALVLDGHGAVVDAAGLDRVLDTRQSGEGNVEIADLTATGGRLPTGPNASAWGGGIRHDGGHLILTGVTVEGNEAEVLGGGIGSQGRFASTRTELTLIDSIVRNNAVTLTGCCMRGGGISLLDADLTASNSVIEGNVASFDGGGIWGMRSTITLEGSTIRSNQAMSGGGIRLDQDFITSTSLTLDGSTVEGNTAQNGGGLYLVSPATITDSVIRGNVAEGPESAVPHGGGMVVAASVTVTRSLLEANQSPFGGAIHNIGLLTVTDSTFDSNRADTASMTEAARGAAIANHTSGQLTVTGSTFADNVATSAKAPRGGGIYNALGAVQVERSTFHGNRTQGTFGSAGSAVTTFGGTVNIARSTITDNIATASALERIAGTLTIRETVVANSGPNCVNVTSAGYNIYDDATCPVAQADVQSAVVALGPLADNGGPTLTRLPSAGSVVLDQIPAGAATRCDAGTPVDQRGLPRPVGGGCDTGAVERQATDP